MTEPKKDEDQKINRYTRVRNKTKKDTYNRRGSI
jgi:hypothetical protein